MPLSLNKKIVKIFFIVAVSVYLVLGFLLFAFQERMIFLPAKLAQDYDYSFSIPFKEIFIESKGGYINALLFKNDKPKGLVIYFHGNSGNLSIWGSVVKDFMPYNYDVFIMDYRSFGKSKGALSEDVFYLDAQACYDYLLKFYPENTIIVYGRSIGTGIAANLASQNKPNHLILESPYYSISDVAQHRFPIFPIKPFLKYQFPTYKFIKDVSCPITIFHGRQDNIIPFSSADKLYKSGAHVNINFVTFDDGNHDNISTFPEYKAHIEKILY